MRDRYTFIFTVILGRLLLIIILITPPIVGIILYCTRSIKTYEIPFVAPSGRVMIMTIVDVGNKYILKNIEIKEEVQCGN